MTRKYLPTLSELIDRLSIVQLKEVFISEHKEEYAKEIADIAHDINMDLDLHPIFHQIDDHIMRYVKAAGIDNEDHWVEKKLKKARIIFLKLWIKRLKKIDS